MRVTLVSLLTGTILTSILFAATMHIILFTQNVLCRVKTKQNLQYHRVVAMYHVTQDLINTAKIGSQNIYNCADKIMISCKDMHANVSYYVKQKKLYRDDLQHNAVAIANDINVLHVKPLNNYQNFNVRIILIQNGKTYAKDIQTK